MCIVIILFVSIVSQIDSTNMKKVFPKLIVI